MAPDESLRERLVRRVTGELPHALQAAFGEAVGDQTLPVALNVLRFDHLAESDLVPWLEDEAGWLARRWPKVCAAIIAAEPVADCADLLRARTAGPGTVEFEDFRASNWARWQGRQQLREEDEEDDGVFANQHQRQAVELAQARLFQTIEEAQATLHRLRDGTVSDRAGGPPPLLGYRGKTSGHCFQDALLDYDPARGGYWRRFLERRFALKLKDARRALPVEPPWEPIPEHGGKPAGADGPEAGSDGEVTDEAMAEGATAIAAAEPGLAAEPFQEIRRRLWQQQSAARAAAKAEADQSLAIFELTYTSWIDPATYSPPTVAGVATVTDRLSKEAELSRLQATWWPAVAGTPPWNELQSPETAVPRLVKAWTSLLAAGTPPEDQAAVQAALRAELQSAAGQPPETDCPRNIPQAARCCVARAAQLAQFPALDKLRRDFAEAEALFRGETDRLTFALAEQTKCDETLQRKLAEDLAQPIPRRQIKQALQEGYWLHHNRKPATPEDAARIKELIRVLAEDDRLRAAGGKALPARARRRLEFELFERSLKSRPVDALEREIRFVQRLLKEGETLGDNGATRLMPDQLATLRRRELLLDLTLAASRRAAAEEVVENLRGPDGNLRRYRERKKFREPDQRPPVRQDRSDRFWIRAQKEVMKLLPSLSQSTLSRRLALFEEWLEDFAEEGDSNQ
jgi:hypothetical protein